MIMSNFQNTLYVLFVTASAALWEDHTDKPSTHVLMSPKLGALREVARDNILSHAREVGSLANPLAPYGPDTQPFSPEGLLTQKMYAPARTSQNPYPL